MSWSYKEFYEANKKEISRKRKVRYRKDRTYREKARSTSRSYYVRVRKKEVPSDRRVLSSPEGDRLMTIGRLSELIHRNIDSIRRYHRQGVIPEPAKFDSRGWRLYTREQASVLMSAFRRLDRKEFRSVREAKDFITNKWRE